MSQAQESIAAIDLTKPIDAGVRVRDDRPTLIMRKGTTLDGLQTVSDIQVFPHAQTHIDLPSCLPLSGWTDGIPEWHAVASAVKSVPACSYPCTVVSLHEYARLMRDSCRGQAGWTDGKPDTPFHFWSDLGVFLNLFQSLRITRDDLEHLDIPNGDFVLFYTGWNEFAPADGDLTHSYWYPWHPYLMNPHLDENAVEYLVDSQDGLDCPGLGFDIGTLESPLRNVAWEAARPPSSIVPIQDWDELMRIGSVTSDAALRDEGRFSPVHIHVLKRDKILLEHAHIPALMLGARDNRKETVTPVAPNDESSSDRNRLPPSMTRRASAHAGGSRPRPVGVVRGTLLLTPFVCASAYSNCLLTAVAFVQQERS